jgi:hypothetical protein
MTSGRLVAALIGAALLVAAAGCGSGGRDADNADSVVLRAVDRTRAAHTAHYEVDIVLDEKQQQPANISSEKNDGGATQHIDGAVDFDAQKGWSHTTSTGTATAKVPLQGQSNESRFTADDLYFSTGWFAQTPRGTGLQGFDWVRMPRPAAAGRNGVGAGISDPFDVLDELRTSASSVKKEGTATIDGVDAVEYFVRFDRAKMARARRVATEVIPRIDLSAHIWLDSHDRLVQEEQHDNGFSLRKRLSRFGADVTVDIPSGPGVYDAGADTGLPESIPDASGLGSWRMVAHGNVTNLRWSVWNQHNDKGYACWTVETDPRTYIPTVSDGAMPDRPHRHDGVDASCRLVPAAGLFRDPIEFPAQTTLDTDLNTELLVGVTVPGMTSVRLTSAGGSASDLPVTNGVFAWSGVGERGTGAHRCDAARWATGVLHTPGDRSSGSQARNRHRAREHTQLFHGAQALTARAV